MAMYGRKVEQIICLVLFLNNVSCINYFDYFQTWNRNVIDNLNDTNIYNEYVCATKNMKHLISGSRYEEVYLNITELILKNGFAVEEHYVQTPDGYVLGLFRIPGKGRPVFLMHGFISSAEDWLTSGINGGLGFLLASNGFDVWLGNARGNKYSKFNVRLKPSEEAYWDFDWHEIGYIDLPAMTDYVLDTTNYNKLTYIGHSQGTTAFFVLCSERPEYNEKISVMISLSSVAWMSHIVSPVRLLAPFTPFLIRLSEIFRLYEFPFDSTLFQNFLYTVCGNDFLAFAVCQQYYFLIGGYDYAQINYKRLSVIFSHAPTGSSLRQAFHYLQLIWSGYFRQFDYGAWKNLKKYGSTVPPSYPVHKITAPVAIIYSNNDWLSNIKDVEILRSNLPNVVDFHEVPGFYHFDYLWAKDFKTILFPRILEHIRNFQ